MKVWGGVFVLYLIVGMILGADCQRLGQNLTMNSNFNQAQFPFTILNKTAQTYILQDNPNIEVYSNRSAFHIASVSLPSIQEIQSIESIWTRTDLRTTMLDRYRNPSLYHTVSNYSLSTPNLWKTSFLESPTIRSLLYTTTLSNNATISIQVFINNVSTLSVPIPRLDQNQCVDANCSCDALHSILKNSAKITIGIKNWPFANSTDSFPSRYLIFSMQMLAPLNFDYYSNSKNPPQVSPSQVCDVVDTNLKLIQNYSFSMSFFNHVELDGIISDDVNLIFGYDKLTLRPNSNEVEFQAYLAFGEFENELYYDPDFSVLLNTGIEEDEENGAGDGGNGGGKKLSGGAIAGVVIGCLVGAVIIAVLVAIAGIVLMKVLATHQEKSRRAARV
eukprot:TRINITY_DN4406_c0_g1_i2.p1 TRINITY_DN4406_c0_g1~~TRINITY_DN4406_c0_g1_i2.p1  ORF type:complete len:389 (-),score=71.97 TRINITY_DN4406_c0_g1_i2:117-1283(-)